MIIGQNQSKVPYSTMLLIKGNDGHALIDCGGGKEVFEYIKAHYHIQDIYLTHYHLDHVWGAHLFTESRVHINHKDYIKIKQPEELAKASGFYAFYGKEKAEQWIVKQKYKEGKPFEPLWKHTIGVAHDAYDYNQPIHIAGERAIMIHTPGHCEGFCVPYFPDYGVAFVGDFDLTSFGPWYNDADSDIDLFIASAKKTLELDADYFVTAHHKGIVSKKDYKEKLDRYLSIIETREHKLKRALDKGIKPKNIVYQEIFYLLKNHHESSLFLKPEILGIAKHLKRMMKNGENVVDYYNEFISFFKLEEIYIDYNVRSMKG